MQEATALMAVFVIRGLMRCRRRTGDVQERETIVAACGRNFDLASKSAARAPWSALDMKCDFLPEAGNKVRGGLVVKQEGGPFNGLGRARVRRSTA